MSGKIRVLVVDDSVVARKLVSEQLARVPEIEVAGTAADGNIAMTRIRELSPDAVVLDIEMPGMDGLRTLEAIRKERKDLPVVMFSTLTEHGARVTLEALDKGASDYVAKPSALRGDTLSGIVEGSLAPKLIALARAKQRPPLGSQVRAPAPANHAPAPGSHRRVRPQIPPKVVVIASSTGGPTALAEVTRRLPATFPLPILIVQHMPPVFTRCLAERLSQQCPLPVREAQGGETVRPGEILLAQGGRHLEVVRSGETVKTRLTDAPPENSCRPAADVLFRSAAQVYGPAVLAVVMTGMGQDGFLGTKEIVNAGGRAIAQSAATCTVWGMPRVVEQAGLADYIVPLTEMAAAMANLARASVFGMRAVRPGGG